MVCAVGGGPVALHGSMHPTLTVTDAPDERARTAIDEGLRRFNVEESGIDDARALAVVATDPETNEVVGGLLGRTSLGLLFVDLLFLPSALRGSGTGSRILRLAEEEARRRGCFAAMLYTISFQAPGFYERHGYRVFGTIPCNPPGTSRVFLTKSL
jgi:GNAT superfamily N-acetyltransferase